MSATARPDSDGVELVIEDLTTGLFANGFGHLADGRPFSFRVHRGYLEVELYRPRLAGPVPLPEDIVAATSRLLTDVDLDDERSLVAAVRDAVAAAAPVR